MKRYVYIYIISLFFATSIVAEPLQGYSFLSPRSQSVDAARELVGWREYINRGDICGFYTAFAAMGIYQKSFRPYRIAEYFFGSNTLSISGSQNAQRDIDEILADYFGLSPLFTSDIALVPEIQNTIGDLDWYLGYNNWYFRIHVPFVRSRTSFCLLEDIHNNGANNFFPALYMDGLAVAPAALSFAQAITQQLTWGQVKEGLQFGRIACSQCKTGTSDVQMALGYNWIATDISHAGFNLRWSVPTGNRSEALFLLEPMIGNGHHWEVGIGFTGHIIVWEKDVDQNLGVYLDINATHLFSAKQRRSFDFGRICCPEDLYNFGSRYILMKVFDSAGNYTGTTVPAINRTTLLCKTYHNFQLDLALMLGYSSCWLDIDLGYSAWIRSKEHVCLLESLPENTYALKGIQNTNSSVGVLSNATQSRTATLVGDNFTDQALVVDTPSPQFVSTADLNVLSAAAPTAFTHKIFWNISHAWKDYNLCRRFTPFIGFGGEAEFESLHPREFTQPNKNSVSQWAIWIKGGFAY